MNKLIYIVLLTLSYSSWAQSNISQSDTVNYLDGVFNEYGKCYMSNAISYRINESRFLSFHHLANDDFSLQIWKREFRVNDGSVNQNSVSEQVNTYTINLNKVVNVKYEIISTDYKGNLACNGWIELKCLGVNHCINTEMKFNPYGPKEVSRKTTDFMIMIPMNSSDEQARKAVKAIKHLWSINGKELEDTTFKKDLF